MLPVVMAVWSVMAVSGRPAARVVPGRPAGWVALVVGVAPSPVTAAMAALAVPVVWGLRAGPVGAAVMPALWAMAVAVVAVVSGISPAPVAMVVLVAQVAPSPVTAVAVAAVVLVAHSVVSAAMAGAAVMRSPRVPGVVVAPVVAVALR